MNMLFRKMILGFLLLTLSVCFAQDSEDLVVVFIQEYRDWIKEVTNALEFIDDWSEEQMTIFYEDIFDAYIPDLERHNIVYRSSGGAMLVLSEEMEGSSLASAEYALFSAVEAGQQAMLSGKNTLEILQNEGQMDRGEFELRMQNFKLWKAIHELWINASFRY